MGLKHLVKVEKLLKKGKKLTFGKLREKTNMNFNTLTEVLSYLLSTKKIEKNEDGYIWQSANTSETEQRSLRPTAILLEDNGTILLKQKKEKSTKSQSK
jgi:transcription initiation factor IIE alpha subunit